MTDDLVRALLPRNADDGLAGCTRGEYRCEVLSVPVRSVVRGHAPVATRVVAVTIRHDGPWYEPWKGVPRAVRSGEL